MATATFDPTLVRTRKDRRGRPPHPAAPPPRPALGALALVLAVAGLVAVVALPLAVEARPDLRAPGGVATFLGGLTGLVGMYLALVMLVIVSRIPVLERIIGQDGMLRWHRRLGPWPISLLVAHALLITIGMAQAARYGFLREVGTIVSSYPDMLAATVGLGLMVLAGVVSIRAIRSRMRRETWWVVHLYMYLALALSFAHVIALGPSFVGHPTVQVVWSVVWAATAGMVVCFRFGLPLLRTLRHRLEVVEVRREAPGVVSVICSGRNLDRLAVSGGQFFAWRFLVRGLWWQAHPYSLSALPQPPHIRLTVRDVGDHSAAVARLRPGTKVAIEGPYGAITPHAMQRDKAVLVAGGIGITALRSLLEDLPKSAKPIVLMRASTESQLVFRDEVSELVRRSRGSLHMLVGPRRDVGTPRQFLRRLVPDLVQRDLFVCGPAGFVDQVSEAAQELGVDGDAIHREVFSW